MNRETLQAFLDEMTKIAQEVAQAPSTLTPMDKEKYLKYGVIGAASGPGIVAARNLMMGTKPGHEAAKGIMRLTGGYKLNRWLPATMATGAAASALIPILRRRSDVAVQKKYDVEGNPLHGGA